jgi:hypothetical protein
VQQEGKSLSARPVISVTVLLLASIGVVPLSATTLFETGFEPPYTTGALAGQFGWTGSTLHTVQTVTVASGLQAVAVDATGQTTQQRAQHTISYSSIGNPEPIVRLSIDFQQSLTGTSSTWTPITLFGSGGFLAAIYVATNGNVLLGGQTFTSTSVFLTRGVWNAFELDADFSAQTVSAYYNGVSLGSTAFANPATDILFAGAALNSSPGTDTVYFDNFSVTSDTGVPEPATVSFVVSGFALLLLGRLFHRQEIRK